MSKKIVLFLVLFCSLILIVVGLAIALQSANKLSENTFVPVNEFDPSDIVVWTIGDSDTLPFFIDAVNSQGVETTPITIQNFESNSSLKSLVLNNQSIIVFGVDWLKQNNNQQLYDFLVATTKDVGGIVVTGESAVDLYIILEKAGLYTIARDEYGALRVPGSEDVTIVGFALKETVTPNGDPYYVPSHFSTASTESNFIMKDILEWLMTT